MNIDINPQFQKALDVLHNTNKHVFITGRAGTGKSTLLEYFRSKTKENIVVLAPTGVAALNVNGQTIHSFFKIPPNISLSEAYKEAKKLKGDRAKLYTKLTTIVIDEISMVRADLFDVMNVFLQTVRENDQPFGGVRVISFGDLYQLPPVARGQEKEDLLTVYPSLYFFGSDIFQELLDQQQLHDSFAFIELEKIYRQNDEQFITLLNAIRDKTLTDEDLATLNTKVMGDGDLSSIPEKSVVLTATNKQAQEINQYKLTQLPSKEMEFSAHIIGNFDQSSFPTNTNLVLKEGARVMMVNNNSRQGWVNGSMATVIDFFKDEEGKVGVVVEFDDGDIEEVYPYTWEMSRSYFDANKQAIERKTIGSFTQFPMRLAWAVTIHKSQGKTFQQVVVDLGRGSFAAGQTYVALSRCVSLDGLYLAKPLKKNNVWLDYSVVKFLTNLQYQLADEKQSKLSKRELLDNAVANRTKIEIVYLKGKNVKSKRVITPQVIETMEFKGHEFLGVEALCHLRNAQRVFNVERILEVREVGGE